MKKYLVMRVITSQTDRLTQRTESSETSQKGLLEDN